MTFLSRLLRHPNNGTNHHHDDGDVSNDPTPLPTAQHPSTWFPRSVQDDDDAALPVNHTPHQGPTPPASQIFLNSLMHLRLRNLPASSSTEETSTKSCPVASMPPPTTTHVECIVCCQNYEEYDVVCVLPCGHMFHSTCIVDWLERRSSCPMCREDFPTDDLAFELQKAKVAAAKRKQQEEQQKNNLTNAKKNAKERSKEKKNRGSLTCRCATAYNNDLPSHNQQDDFMFLPPNLSVPLDTDDEHESSDEEGDSVSLPQNFDLIMRRVLRSKAELRAKHHKQHP